MRITGGESRGRNIGSPSGRDVRPTASKVRQALFNIIGPRIQDARFLDICAGSGLVGLEAMSRGAKALTSVEQDKVMATNLAASAKQLGYAIRVLPLNFKTALRLLHGQQYDLIFADPPYKSGFARAILTEVSKHELLAEGGILVIEHLSNATADLAKTPLIKFDTRSYGQTALSFFTCVSGDA